MQDEINQCCIHFAKEIALHTMDNKVSYGDLHRIILHYSFPQNAFPCWILPVETSPFFVIAIIAALYHNIPLYLLPSPIFLGQAQDAVRSFTFEDFSTIALLLPTSGTTSAPKIAQITANNLLHSAKYSHPDWQLIPGDHYFLSLPLHHISGIMILLRTFFHGATLLLGPTIFSKKQTTHLSLVTTQLSRLVNNPPCISEMQQLKGILLGGGPMPFSLCQEATRQGWPIFPSYGMTEMTSQITTHRFSLDDMQQTFGHPLSHRQLKISKEGEILVKGNVLFAGYLGQKHQKPDEWFPTKDLGSYDSNVGLRVYGRKDRMFISGGENIYPEEIEEILRRHPKIVAARITGLEDPHWGRRCTAHLTITRELSSAELKEYLASYLPNYKIPKEFIFSFSAINAQEDL